MKRSLLTSVLVALSLAFTAAGAQADQGSAVIRDCLNHGHLTGHYSQQAYSQALAEMPTDVSEYSDCPNLIRAAQLAAASGGGGGSGSGGSGAGAGGSGTSGGPPPSAFTPAERRALAQAGRQGGQAINLGGQLIRPGLVHADVASALSNLPTPLLALLVALAAGALVGLATLTARRVRARRPV